MASAVNLSEELISDAEINSKAFNRSLEAQIEHWAKIGKIIEENPDLTYDFIKTLLIAQEEVKLGKFEPYRFEDC